jgi:hypothetical protein
MVHSGCFVAPQAPRARKRPGEAVALLDFAYTGRSKPYSRV